jgi:predicted O-methyltransferase YrrM
MMDFLKNKLKKAMATSQKKLLHDSVAISKLNGILDNYVVWTSSSIRPSAITMMLNDIVINDRKKIIEFGSGISTLYIAKSLKDKGGTLISVEHDLGWISVVRSLLSSEQLDSIVEFVHAPLTESSLSLNGLSWYNEETLTNFLKNRKFDFILVDGPLAYTRDLKLSRYPVLPFLNSLNCIEKNVSIYLDDIERSGESEVVRLWEREYNYNFSKNYIKGGIAVCFLGESYTVD